MFRYISPAKLVATYLREFSFKERDNLPTRCVATDLYRFVLCCCLPFVSESFRRARLIALAIAECTDSQDQIKRLVNKITGADMEVIIDDGRYFTTYKGGDVPLSFSYNNTANAPIVPFGAGSPSVEILVYTNEDDEVKKQKKIDEVSALLDLLIPFYVSPKITYI